MLMRIRVRFLRAGMYVRAKKSYFIVILFRALMAIASRSFKSKDSHSLSFLLSIAMAFPPVVSLHAKVIFIV